MNTLTLEAFSALEGKELGVSEWILVSQESINAFADATRDWQYIHVDEKAARNGPFGGTIAHGFLTLSLLSAMSAGVIPTLAGTTSSVNYGFNSLRFVSPVRSGEHVRGRFGLKAVTRRSENSYQLTVSVSVEIEQKVKPALVGEWVIIANV